MRLFFHSVDQPKRIAKSISRHIDAQLALCQAAVARASGYRDWHELNVTVLSRTIGPLFALAPLEQQVKFVVDVGSELQADLGLIQFAISHANAFTSEMNRITQQLALRAAVFRATTIPDLGSRQPGSVGIAKPWKEPVIVRLSGKPTQVLSHKSVNGIIADHELQIPPQPIDLFIPMRLYLLYGMYIEADGTKVLYSRDYEPLWRLADGKKPERFVGPQHIDFVKRIGFWDDTSTPWRNQQRYAEELERLERFGITGLPWKVETLPDLIYGATAQ